MIKYIDELLTRLYYQQTKSSCSYLENVLTLVWIPRFAIDILEEFQRQP
jgi:hypothetical protein